MRFKSVEICPVGNRLPGRVAMLRDHKPIRTKEEFNREFKGYIVNLTWEDAIQQMRLRHVESLWLTGKMEKE